LTPHTNVTLGKQIHPKPIAKDTNKDTILANKETKITIVFLSPHSLK